MKARLETFDRKGLVRLIADLYDASSANRRFLESRFLPESGVLEEYRRIVADAIYPDPFSRRPNRPAALGRRCAGDVRPCVRRCDSVPESEGHLA